MPVKLAEDEYTITVQGDDGQIVSVAKPVAERLFPDLGVTLGTPPAPAIPETVPPGGAILPPAVVPEPPATMPPTGGPTYGEGDAGWLGVTPREPGAELPRFVGEEPVTPEEPPGAIDLRPQPPAKAPAPAAPEPAEPPPPGMPSIRSGFERQAQGVMARAEAEQQGQVDIAQTQRESNEDIATTQAYQQMRSDEIVQEKAQLRETLNADIEKYQNMDIDRGRFWENRSTGQRVLAGISLALGALGMALKGRGGENPALDIIMKAIDDDVRDQQASIAKAGRLVDVKRGMYAQFLQESKDELEAYDKTTAFYIGQVARQVEAIKTQTSSEVVAANAEIALGQLQQVYGNTIAAAADKIWEREDKNRKFAADERHRKSMRGVAWHQAKTGRMAMEARKAEAEAKKKALEKAAEEKAKQGVVVNPFTSEPMFTHRYWQDLKSVKESNAKLLEFSTARDRLTELRSMINEAGRRWKVAPKFVRSQIHQEITSLSQELARDWLKTKEEGGRFTNEDVEQAKEAIGGGVRGLLQRANPGAILDKVIRRMDIDTGRQLMMAGATPDQAKEFVKTAYGKLDRVWTTKVAQRTKAEDKFYAAQYEMQESRSTMDPQRWISGMERLGTGEEYRPAAPNEAEMRRAVDAMAQDARHGSEEDYDQLVRLSEVGKGAAKAYALQKLEELKTVPVLPQ